MAPKRWSVAGRRTGSSRLASALAVVALVAATLLVGAACEGTGDDAAVIPADTTPDAPPDTAPAGPECDPAADPTGCDDGALCWYERCAAFAKAELAAGADARVGSVTSLADDEGGAAVAWHERRVTTDESGALVARQDVVFVSFFDAGAAGAPAEVARWDVDAVDAARQPGPRLALVRAPDGGITLVRGPEPLVAYRWQSGAWAPSEAVVTGARLTGSEGSLAAVHDASGRLHVAWHDTQTSSLDIATLAPDGAWIVQPVFDLAAHYGRSPWGSRIAAADLGERVAFAHILSSELDATIRRGAVVVDQVPGGWETSTPSLAKGLVIEGRVTGFAATADGAGHLTLAWLPHTRQIGVAVRGDDGDWAVDKYLDASDTNVSDDVFDNLAVAWWQDAVVLAWLGFPETECACFDLRAAMVRDGAWLEYRVDRFADFSPAALDLAIGADGGVLLPVGGGPFTTHGTAAPIVFTGQLPDWTEAP